MTISAFDPILDITSLRDSMDRVFREVMDARLPGLSAFSLQPAPMDMYEEEGALVARISLPGFKADEINVSVDGTVLSITAETEQERTEDKTYHLHERHAGRVERLVTLPFAVQTEGAEATFQDGTLNLRLPRAPGAEARRIPVKG